MKGNKICKGYCGIACVDGTCPKARQDEYAERCMPVITSCSDCLFYKGCDDCAFDGTEYCCKK